MSPSEEHKKIVLIVGGSIAAFKAASLASSLVKDSWSVQCVLTANGRNFLGEATLEGLTGRAVLSDTFERGRAMDHINLVEWADVFLCYPASANQINRMRMGAADDLAGALFLANNFHKPWWIAPAMNSRMFEHPATAEALEILGKWGCRILPTESGRLACGTEGDGRLIEPEAVFKLLTEKNHEGSD